MSSLRPQDVMVFVGAGASLSMPAGLPMFNWLRDEVLRQFDLDEYLPDGGADSVKATAARGLAPEPFMAALTEAGVRVEDWLGEVLGGGGPNAAHQLIAHLAHNGSPVWTVNFDTLIEDAATRPLPVNAWPAGPTPGTAIRKPHGSLGGSLIVTAEQVLAGLDEKWLNRLRADVAGRTVVFLGYSGRDLDFQPHWDDVLQDATEVLWFDRPDPSDQERKRLLLRRVAARGDLHFPASVPPPAGVSATGTNPSWDFVAWCTTNGLGTVSDDQAAALFDPVPDRRYPVLPGDRRWAKPAVLGLLGDHRAARTAYLALTPRPRHTRRAARAVAVATVNHGGRPVAATLRTLALMTALPPLRRWRQPLEQKRLSILANLGDHRAVLDGTRSLPPDAPSTLLVLRAASIRMTGSLDEAASTAAEAYERALREQHPVRVANAAFQKCFALMWAHRLDEAETCLDDEFEPRATIAAMRWIAWSEFLRGQLAVRGGRPIDALAHFELAEARFRADGLADGVVDVTIARLAALRLRRDDAAFRAAVDGGERLSANGLPGQRYYTRRHPFTRAAIDLEHAEFARTHLNDLDAARIRYRRAANCPYPLNAAFGHLGLAMLDHDHDSRHAEIALNIATRINARLIITRARQLLGHQPGDPMAELFFS